jgi:hypothetical protein
MANAYAEWKEMRLPQSLNGKLPLNNWTGETLGMDQQRLLSLSRNLKRKWCPR